MPVEDVIFVGAAHAFHEISEILRDLNAISPRYRIAAILDDNTALHGRQISGVEVVGGLDLAGNFPNSRFVFGIGSFRTRLLRRRILSRMDLPDDQYVTLIHPAAKVYRGASVGAGSIIHHGAVVGHGACLAPHTIVTFNAIVGPEVMVDRAAMIASSATILTGVRIGTCAFIGAAACVAESIRVGPGAMIAMGTHVYREVPPGAYILGSPPREITREDVSADLLANW